MLKVAVLVSGGGTNLQAILDAIDSGKITNAQVSLVISNNPNAYALERAKNHEIESICISPGKFENREEFHRALLKAPEIRSLEFLLTCLLPPVVIFSDRAAAFSSPSTHHTFYEVKALKRPASICRLKMKSQFLADKPAGFPPSFQDALTFSHTGSVQFPDRPCCLLCTTGIRYPHLLLPHHLLPWSEGRSLLHPLLQEPE